MEGDSLGLRTNLWEMGSRKHDIVRNFMGVCDSYVCLRFWLVFAFQVFL